ncbi:CHAT domain-containing protein, partial [Duganella sp. FT92W]
CLARLASMRARIDAAGLAPAQRAALLLNLGHQAAQAGTPALALAYGSLAQARDLAVDGSRLKAEALDALAQLYEGQRQGDAAQALTQAALEHAGRQPPGAVADLVVALEWRLARLSQAQGRVAAALAAYQRAADQLERLRPDMPIELDDGRTSFRALFEPIYLGLADALLQAADGAPAAAGDYLRRARDAAELIKQSELQDYLGDRCATDSVKGGSPTVIPAGTAVLYPLIFPGRTELLLETAGGITRYTSKVDGADVRATATAFARALRNGDSGYQAAARSLYDWLLRPIDAAAAAGHIDTLVVVPDGALRLVPIGALHDGSRFAIERYAISTVTGLSMTNTGAPAAAGDASLVAGAAQFGGVVDKLMLTAPGKRLARDLARNVGGSGVAQGRMLRAPVMPAGASGERLVQDMRAALALPGVEREVAAVGALLPGVALLDERFSVSAFSQAAGSGDYSIVHVASHGIFGGSADASFVLAYDDLLTLDRLQTLLSGEQFRRHPIELLTLSACETAEGNDRAPLGISGAAIKARAKSVLGTLWPVDDEAAVQLMQQFYRGLKQRRLSKTQALRQAQLDLIRTAEYAHPLYWAPFSLIGNWL